VKATTDLRDVLINQGVFPAKEKENISVVFSPGNIRRHKDKQSRRYIISYHAQSKYILRCIPSGWKYSPDTILETISRYTTLRSIKVPKLIAHFSFDGGYCFVEEFLPNAVSLSELIERGELTKSQGAEVMRKLFVELYEKGTKLGKKTVESEKEKCLSSLRAFFREGLWSDIICEYVGKAIDKQSGIFREVLTTGDLIDRNFIRSNGSWYLIDFEYSHRTVFFFKDAYRNTLYAPWTNGLSFAEFYPPLGAFPPEIAAIITLALEREFQAGLLNPEASEDISKHLRYLLWNLIEPEILVRLDQRLHLAQQEAANSSDEIGKMRTLADTREQHLAEKTHQLGLLTAELSKSREDIARLNGQLQAQALISKEMSLRIEGLEEAGKQQEEKIIARDRQVAKKEERLRVMTKEVERFENDLLFLQKSLAEKNLRIKEMETWGNELLELTKQKESTIRFQQKSIEGLAASERTLSSQLAEKEAAYLQKTNEFIYIKSTLSYTAGRIITFPFELLFNGVMKIFGIVDNIAGKTFWPQGTKRALVVNAVVNLKQTIVTATYLLHMHGVRGLMNGVRQTWQSGANLGLHRNFVQPVPQQAVPLKPVRRQPLKQSAVVENTGAGVSVVIPTLNGCDDLMKLLPTLLHQQGFRTIEIVVVDSGSTDGTVEYAKELGAHVIEIPQSSFTHSSARNLGAEHATQEYLLFMVQDALPVSDEWLYRMFSFMKKENVAAVSCGEIPGANADLFSRVQQWYHYEHFLQLTAEDKVLSMPDARDSASMRKHGQLTDVACLFKKNIYMKYKFRFEYAEDLDMGIRLIRDGHKIGLMSSTRVIHSHTRPPYHHLKRGFIDKLVLAKILNEPLNMNSLRINFIQADILLTYQALSNLKTGNIFGTKKYLNISELRNYIDNVLTASSTTKLLGTMQISENEFIDPQFKAFLTTIAEKYQRRQQKDKGDGTILRGIQQFLAITFEYMEGAYELIDESIMRDLLSLMYKHFANLSGVYIALCTGNPVKADEATLIELTKELGDNKILWEKTQGSVLQ
jgi:glycosyltransferase involved in cell wall biosynthesis